MLTYLIENLVQFFIKNIILVKPSSAQPNLSPQVNYAPGLVFGSRRAYYNSLRTPAVQPAPRLVRQNKVYFNLRSPAV